MSLHVLLGGVASSFVEKNLRQEVTAGTCLCFGPGTALGPAENWETDPMNLRRLSPHDITCQAGQTAPQTPSRKKGGILPGRSQNGQVAQSFGANKGRYQLLSIDIGSMPMCARRKQVDVPGLPV